MSVDFVFTSGSVTRGHPDKLCDQISDAIVDACLRQDPASRVNTECAISGGVLFISHRAASEAVVDLAETARAMVTRVGYAADHGEFNARDCSVMISQAALGMAVGERHDLAALTAAQRRRIPAGNQVTLFGYACRQTPQLMPLPVVLAHRLVQRLDQVVAHKELDYLAPDGQAQVGIIYAERRPVGIHSLNLIAAQRPDATTDLARLRDDLLQAVVEPVMAESELRPDNNTHLVVNPEGLVIGGGPMLHSGLTGRKTGIDTYGEYARHSGAALSGKDPLRIDRIGAYAARHAAKLVVAAGLAEECEVQLSYAVGQAEPVSLRVHSYGSGQLDDDVIATRIRQAFDFRPGSIAQAYELQHLPQQRHDFFSELACYGQLGREDLAVPWEALDKVDALKG
jgi:S-adenosylmethionine synthetase